MLSQPHSGYICQHLEEYPDSLTAYFLFTGEGAQYFMVCKDCLNLSYNIYEQLRPAPQSVMRSHEFSASGRKGEPQILTRSTSLALEHQDITLSIALPGTVLDAAPLKDTQWLLLLSTGYLVKLDITQSSFETVYHFSPQRLTLSEEASLIVDRKQQFAAVVNTKGQHGAVINMENWTMTMMLDRGTYHISYSSFPVAFFEHRNNTYLVHGTDWNRLDISEPGTGSLVTVRDTAWPPGGKRPDHYLDYFHSGLSVSPSGHRIAEDGWAWSPVGVTRFWDLKHWIEHNVWESEDGASVTYINQRGYLWDTPIFWVDDDTLAVWGLGNDDEWVVPALVFYDAQTGQPTRWFPGPEQGKFALEDYLYCMADSGLSVWNIKTGERLLEDDSIQPVAYHPASRHFLTALSDKDIRVSVLTGDAS